MPVTERPLHTLPTNLRFHLGKRWHDLVTCVCLYRVVDPATRVAKFLVLTKDRRFAYLESVVGEKGVRPATEMTREQAIRFLAEHGENDVVEEFPDVFRDEPGVRKPAASDGAIAAAPKDRPAEPYLFPLH